MMDVINAFTVDVEDWYQAVTSLNKRRNEWDKFESRVEKNTYRLLSLLNEYNIQATFFTCCRTSSFVIARRTIEVSPKRWKSMKTAFGGNNFCNESTVAIVAFVPSIIKYSSIAF